MLPEDVPDRPGAYMDQDGKIWLFEAQTTTPTLQIRTPGGWVTIANSTIGRKVLAPVTELRRMVPLRRR